MPRTTKHRLRIDLWTKKYSEGISQRVVEITNVISRNCVARPAFRPRRPEIKPVATASKSDQGAADVEELAARTRKAGGAMSWLGGLVARGYPNPIKARGSGKHW
jgi:hypothetical protein